MSRPLPGILAVCLFASLGAVAAEPVPQTEPKLSPTQAADALTLACSERRYSDAGEWLHSTLRRKWVEIGYSTAQFCAAITRDDTLRAVETRREYVKDDYAVVELTFVYADGSKREDRETFLREAGRWKLAN